MHGLFPLMGNAYTCVLDDAGLVPGQGPPNRPRTLLAQRGVLVQRGSSARIRLASGIQHLLSDSLDNRHSRASTHHHADHHLDELCLLHTLVGAPNGSHLFTCIGRRVRGNQCKT